MEEESAKEGECDYDGHPEIIVFVACCHDGQHVYGKFLFIFNKSAQQDFVR
jgi:hypothetical protein